MKEQLKKRVLELETEYQKGQNCLQELEAEAENLRGTLLRISGAIQVLNEELTKVSEESSPGAS